MNLDRVKKIGLVYHSSQQKTGYDLEIIRKLCERYKWSLECIEVTKTTNYRYLSEMKLKKVDLVLNFCNGTVSTTAPGAEIADFLT